MHENSATTELAATAELSALGHPLCIDLDGTLVKSDTLFDSLCQLLRQQPCAILALTPLARPRKGSTSKSKWAAAPLSTLARLPYNIPLLRYLQAERREGRTIYLTTGADGALARRVAATWASSMGYWPPTARPT